MATSSSEFIQLQLQLRCKPKLISALKKVDLKVLSEELCKTNIITERTRSDFNNLDRRVDHNIKVRYLYTLVCCKVCQSSTFFEGFLNTISKWHQMKHVCEFLRREISEVPEQVQTLSADDIPVLLNDLASVAHKWEELGIAVNIPNARLTDIAKERVSSEIKLHRVLSTWIIEGTSLKEVTPRKIKEVLASPLVGLPSIAENLSFDNLLPSFRSPHIDSTQGSSSSIIYQSINTVVNYGMSTLLEVQVTSDKLVFYQWTKDGQPLSDDIFYQGTSSNILLISHRNMASRHIEGKYVCEVEGIGKSRDIFVTIEYPASIQHLLSRYSLLRGDVTDDVPKDSWPRVRIKSFIDLALIKRESENLQAYDYSVRGDMDDVLCTKETISYEECFGEYRSGFLLVVDGRPGVGKTTLAHKVTRDWSTGEHVLVGADLVCLVSLRLLNVNKTNSIFKLLGFKCNKLDKELINDFESRKHLKICFILDGLDEFKSYSYQKNIVYNLINKMYSKAMVIVFSRPVGNKKLEKCGADVNRRIEILGFKSEQISHYIDTYFQEDVQKAEKIKNYLEEHINVLHMCYLPVHVAMICYIHSRYKDSDILNTETQIYERFAMLTIIRKLRRECKDKVSNQPTHFQSLSERDRKFLIKICQLAFDMCVDHRQVFEKWNSDIDDNGVMLSDESDSDGPSLGLVTVDSTAEIYNYHDVYAFLHLTFQEFLAAYHIFSQTSDQQLSIIDQHKDNDAMLVVWKFYCGIMGQKRLKFHEQIQTIFSSKHADTLYRVHCAFESQQPAICDLAMDCKEQQRLLSFQNKILTSGDCNAISYVMSEASGPISTLAFHSCRLQENGVKQLIETTGKNRLQMVNTFVFHSSNPTLKQLECVNSLLSRMKSLEILDLFKTTLSQDTIIKLTENVTLSHLKCLKIKIRVPFKYFKKCFLCLHSLNFNSKPEFVYYHMETRIFQSDTRIHNMRRELLYKDWYQSVLECVFKDSTIIDHDKSPRTIANLSSVQLESSLDLNIFSHCSTFCFVGCSITDNTIITFSKSLNYSNAVEKLNLDFNDICQGAAALVSRCTKLKHLSIRCNSINDEGAKSLGDSFKSCTNLQTLIISRNRIGSEGAASLADGLKSCTDLQTLDISRNSIGLEGAAALADSLKSFSDLRTLDIGKNSIGSEGAAALAGGLKDCIDLQILDINDNNIGLHGVTTLADGLKSCTNLQTLDISRNSISSEGVAALADCLKSCTNLQMLDISCNSVGVEGAAALADGLKSCTNLETLNISDISIDSEGAAALGDGLKSCTNLQKMDISNNSIGSEGAAALVDGLKLCTKLETLDISWNCIGLDGAATLADGFKSYNNLRTLNLTGNDVDSESAEALDYRLKSCTTLQI